MINTEQQRWDEFHGLKKCDNPECFRQVRNGVEFCCGPCGTANGKYEIHGDGPLGHTIGCNERDVQRRDQC